MFIVSAVNDAGKELADHPGRVEAFLDFLGTGPDDPRRGGGKLYSAREFGEAPRKVILRLFWVTRGLEGGKWERSHVVVIGCGVSSDTWAFGRSSTTGLCVNDGWVRRAGTNFLVEAG